MSKFSLPDTYGRRKAGSNIITGLCVLAALATVAPLGLVLFHLVSEGLSSVNLNFFTHLPRPMGEKGGGMAHAIAGTFTLLGLASIVGIPIGLLGGVYLAEYGTARVNWFLRFAADVVNGVPSIIWGVVAWGLIVAHRLPYPVIDHRGFHFIWKQGFSAYAGGLALAFIMIPLIMRSTEEVLLLVPTGYREAALALGVARWRIVTQIVVRTATKGLITGVLLALARVAGETAPLLFTALGNNYWNRNLADPIAALPLQIFAFASSPDPEWRRQAWAGALVLVTISLSVNIFVRFFTRTKAR